MRHLLVILSLFFSPGSLPAQYDNMVKTKNAKESLQIAQTHYHKGALEKARDQLLHTVKLKNDFAVAYRLLGKIYMEFSEYENAVDAFESSFAVDSKLSRVAYFECGDAYLQLSKPGHALYYYQMYEALKEKGYANKKKEASLEVELDEKLPGRFQSVALLQQIDSSLITAYPENLGWGINTELDEYVPSIHRSGDYMLFTRGGKKENENVYFTKRKTEGWTKARMLSDEFNTPFNEGMATFAPCCNIIYFTGCQRDQYNSGCDIYMAQTIEDVVYQATKLEGGLNSPQWDSQPSISCEGKLMFFSSNREGGYGGADIYVTRQQESGLWSPPSNLGPVVNTPGDEESPFIAPDGNTLYFVSDGHPGYGFGDLFVCRKKSGGWTTPENLGFPINSPSKELGIHVLKDGKTAIFGSARMGGTGGMDLYQGVLNPQHQPRQMVFLTGKVVTKHFFDPVPTAQVIIDSEDEKWQIVTDSSGYFFLCLPAKKGYSFQVRHPGFEFFIEGVYLKESEEELALELEPKDKNYLHEEKDSQALLVNKAVRKEELRIQFFFPFDSYTLTAESKNSLNTLVSYLSQDKSWKVEVTGYADKKGNKRYNIKLSEKRAQAIVDYLNDKGIPPDIILKSEGKGAIKGQEEVKSRRVDVVLFK